MAPSTDYNNLSQQLITPPRIGDVFDLKILGFACSLHAHLNQIQSVIRKRGSCALEIDEYEQQPRLTFLDRFKGSEKITTVDRLVS